MNWIEIGLYLISILIWGSTWLVIKFQLGIVHPAVSVGYRFLVAAVLLLAFAVVRGKKLRFPLTVHGLIAAQSLFLFCLNYLCLYFSEQSLTSGVVAILFSLLTVSNAIGAKFLFDEQLTARFWWGTAIGVAGILLVFSSELKDFTLTHDQGVAFGLAILGTLSASAGNLISKRLYQHSIEVIPVTAIGMAYGAFYTLAGCFLLNLPFVFPRDTTYLAALLYLAVFGSIIAFVSYLTVLRRIGAAKAGYMSIITPVVAILLSMIFEGLRATPIVIFGMILSLAGNALVMIRRRKTSI